MIPMTLWDTIQDEKLVLIAGPCVVEGEEPVMHIASRLLEVCKDLPVHLVFKASYRKANRSSISSFTGIGDAEALRILEKVKSEYGLPLTTDIHTDEEAAMAAEVVDILQIPAFLCRQTSLLQAAAHTGKIVNIKKGQFMSPSSMAQAVNKVKDSDNHKVMLTERGTTFGYQDLVVDFNGIPTMKAENGVPIIMDCTHSLQRPNQSAGVTGGKPEFIQTMVNCGIAAGADGLFVETHHDLANAKSDAANMLPLDQLRPILEKALRLWEAMK